jgi:hypothetical protein
MAHAKLVSNLPLLSVAECGVRCNRGWKMVPKWLV